MHFVHPVHSQRTEQYSIGKSASSEWMSILKYIEFVSTCIFNFVERYPATPSLQINHSDLCDTYHLELQIYVTMCCLIYDY